MNVDSPDLALGDLVVRRLEINAHRKELIAEKQAYFAAEEKSI